MSTFLSKVCELYLESEELISIEPPCWGSGEAPLIPVALKTILMKQNLNGLLRRRKEVSLPLSAFASENWREDIGPVTTQDESTSLLDMIIAALEECYQKSPDRFDIPFVNCPFDRFDGALKIPFEFRTWELLRNAGVESDLDVFVIFTSTVYELRSRLGDMRAALDVAVTGNCWLTARATGSYGFTVPKQPRSLKEAGDLVRVRSFRNCGMSPVSKTYRIEIASAMGLRWAVGVDKKKTLVEIADLLGVTRERVRQIDSSRPWNIPVRVWGMPKILREIADQLMAATSTEICVSSSGEQIAREDAIALLISYGFPEEIFKGKWQVDDELALLEIKINDLKRTAYVESERLGFLTQTELEHHIAEQFPMVVGKMFDEVISRLVKYGDLPYGYVYVEQYATSYFKSWVVKLLKVMGPLSFVEIYKASERYCVFKIARLVFPHRSVIEAFFHLDPEFLVKDGRVALVSKERVELDGVEKWVQQQIEKCSESVISKTELYERARADGIKHGTLNVYCSYSLYFKPCGYGCVTLTGLNPSNAAIELARIRGMAIRVKTVRGEIKVKDGVVAISLQVGNDVLDTGVFPTNKELRDLLVGQSFRLVSGVNIYGHCGWSGNTLFGFQGVLQAMSVQPGDEVEIAFNLSEGEAVLDFVNN